MAPSHLCIPALTHTGPVAPAATAPTPAVAAASAGAGAAPAGVAHMADVQVCVRVCGWSCHCLPAFVLFAFVHIPWASIRFAPPACLHLCLQLSGPTVAHPCSFYLPLFVFPRPQSHLPLLPVFVCVSSCSCCWCHGCLPAFVRSCSSYRAATAVVPTVCCLSLLSLRVCSSPLVHVPSHSFVLVPATWSSQPLICL